MGGETTTDRGEYFEDCNIVIPGGHMRDDAMAKKLWTVSEELTRDFLKSQDR